MFSVCRIKNKSGAATTLRGHYFEIDELYTIPDPLRVSWATSDEVIAAIGSGDFAIFDDVSELGISEGVDLLKNVVPVKAEIEKEPPFAEPTYRTKYDATDELITCEPDTVTSIDFEMPEELYVHGGAIVVKNAKFGDSIVAQVRDDAGLIPEAYRAALCEAWPVVAEYVPKQFIHYLGGEYTVHCICTKPLNAKITAGLTLRIAYDATAEGLDREVAVNYMLTKKL